MLTKLNIFKKLYKIYFLFDFWKKNLTKNNLNTFIKRRRRGHKFNNVQSCEKNVKYSSFINGIPTYTVKVIPYVPLFKYQLFFCSEILTYHKTSTFCMYARVTQVPETNGVIFRIMQYQFLLLLWSLSLL